MKKFKDLKVGDTIYVSVEKKCIADIKPDPLFEDYDYIKIYTSDGEVYVVLSDESSFYDCGEDMLISVDKEAAIKHCTDALRDLQIDYEDNKAYFEKMLEKAKALK
jgi:hypothetical protein